ncbi:hypothetical protein PR048_022436 [Dryococelus australis]|uniref:Uncharacterized protein n=1 Tax=Dryococelus australis TaxID=614101 RepID=A0ABQ9H1A1_9NEOP|nr:hypothetical protein PR048_022436 [Dryococelus australis]
MEQRRNESAGETGDPRVNPPTNDIVRLDPACENPDTPAQCSLVLLVELPSAEHGEKAMYHAMFQPYTYTHLTGQHNLHQQNTIDCHNIRQNIFGNNSLPTIDFVHLVAIKMPPIRNRGYENQSQDARGSWRERGSHYNGVPALMPPPNHPAFRPHYNNHSGKKSNFWNNKNISRVFTSNRDELSLVPDGVTSGFSYVGMVLVGWFVQGSPVCPALVFCCCPYLPCFTLICSEDLIANCRPNFFTLSCQRLVRSPPINANQVQSRARSLPHFCKWELCRAIPLVGWFSWGSPVSSALAFKCCSILISFYPHRLSRPHYELPEYLNSRFGRLLDSKYLEQMRMIEVSMEQHCNERARKWEIPEKTSRSAASSGMISTCENPGVTQPGLNPVFPGPPRCTMQDNTIADTYSSDSGFSSRSPTPINNYQGDQFPPEENLKEALCNTSSIDVSKGVKHRASPWYRTTVHASAAATNISHTTSLPSSNSTEQLTSTASGACVLTAALQRRWQDTSRCSTSSTACTLYSVQQFHLEVQHCPSKDNYRPDALSRQLDLEDEAKPDENMDHVTPSQPPDSSPEQQIRHPQLQISRIHIKHCQQQDPDVKDLL